MSSLKTAETRPAAVPYVAYNAFESFMGQLDKLPDVPRTVAKDMMDGMSGATQSHLFTALKALRLIDDNGVSQPMLSTLVKAHGTNDWTDTLANFIKESYADVIGELDIKSASQSQLKKCFSDQSPAIRDKAIRFYINALKDSGIQFSPLLTKRKPRSKNGTRKPSPTKNKGKPHGNKAGDGTGFSPPPPPAEGTVQYPLYFRDKPDGALVVPKDLSEADCRVIELQLQVLKAYAGQEGE